MSEFEKFDGTSSPSVHITMFYRRMIVRVDNDELLIYCFQDSLKGSASRWYNQLTWHKIRSWKDLDKAFTDQYKHITEIEPKRLILQNMEMRTDESFMRYVQRWRDVAAKEGINHTKIFSNIPKGSAYQREGRNKVKVKDLKPKRIKDYLECKISQRKKPSFTTSRYVLNLPPGED
ncbi:hypothetical protein GQ457_01G017460 [Hibiscus cannabinus]